MGFVVNQIEIIVFLCSSAAPLSSSKSMENNATCRDQPTMVSKPYYRVDLFNRQMTDVLLTSLLVTTIENKTVAHIGTSNGRLLQVHLFFTQCS